MNLSGEKKTDVAWKSKVLVFMQGPLQWRKNSREDKGDTNVQWESLETLLCSKGGQRAFREFLKKEFCEENLDFWLACQKFQSCEGLEELTQKAEWIYEEFIREDSPKQVNLDFYTTEHICQSLQQPHTSIFEAAQKKIFSLMENGSFTRFVQTEQYKGFTEAAPAARGLQRHRPAFRVKSAGEDSKVDRPQSDPLLVQGEVPDANSQEQSCIESDLICTRL